MLPLKIVPAEKGSLISGLEFSSGNMSGPVLLLFVLFAFAMPGVQHWSFLPDEPWFGIDQSLFEHDRLVVHFARTYLDADFHSARALFHTRWRGSNRSWKDSAREGVKDLIATIRQVKHYANIARYLLARILYNDDGRCTYFLYYLWGSGVFWLGVD